MMTRQHFELLAHSLKRCKPQPATDLLNLLDARAAFSRWQFDVQCIMHACQQSNPAFDMRRFLAACGDPMP